MKARMSEFTGYLQGITVDAHELMLKAAIKSLVAISLFSGECPSYFSKRVTIGGNSGLRFVSSLRQSCSRRSHGHRGQKQPRTPVFIYFLCEVSKNARKVFPLWKIQHYVSQHSVREVRFRSISPPRVPEYWLSREEPFLSQFLPSETVSDNELVG